MKRLFVLFTLWSALVSRGEEPVFVPGEEPALVLSGGAGEGPAWHPRLGLFFSGGNRITRLHPNGQSDVFRDPAGSNGLLFDRQGRLLVCEPGQRRVTRTDLNSGTIEVLTDSYEGRRYNQPNDITIDSRGRIYFSDPRYGSPDDMQMVDSRGRPIEGVYRIDPDGSVSRIITHEVDRPNGLVVTADDKFLIVADNNNNTVGGARKLWRFDLRPDGTVSHDSRHLVFDWTTERGPDGMALDRQRRLYVAGGRNEPAPPYETADKLKGGIYVFSPQGEHIAFVPVPRDEVTNCTFGGYDLRTLFITAGGTLWSIRTTTAGWLPSPAP